MIRKKRNAKLVTKKIKSKKKTIISTSISQFLRCKEWVKSQFQEQKTKLENIYNDNSSSSDSEPGTAEIGKVPTSTESLAILKKIPHKIIKERILYMCEWRNCKSENENDSQLYKHIVSHINELSPINDNYYCFWDLCKFNTKCNKEITRHIYYHIYHTKLKTIGESVSQLANIPRCTNDSKNRNVIPDLKNDFICLWANCNRTFLSIILFCQHVKNHCITSFQIMKSTIKLQNPKVLCEWENCNMKFSVKYRLIEHISKHTNEKNVGCYHCGALFKRNTILLDHCKRQLANNTQDYQCAQCFKYFSSERLLRRHVPTHVSGFKCSLCDMTCNSTYGLARHVRYRHLSIRPFQCMECEKRFVTKSDLETHIQSIHKKKIYECDEPECDYIAKSLSSMKRHDAEVHANNKIIYACHWCDNKYKRGTQLSKHLINVHKFKLPSGHQRFRYRIHEDGFYRIELMRFETLEVTKQILSPRVSKFDDHCLEDNCSEISESIPVQINAIHDNSTDQFVVEYIEIGNENVNNAT